MEASQHTTHQDPQAAAAELTASMEALARHGDWDQVEEIAGRIRAVVMQVPEAHRRETLLAVGQMIETVQSLAKDARNDVTEKLSAIRRGKDATAAYGSATGTERALRGGP